MTDTVDEVVRIMRQKANGDRNSVGDVWADLWCAKAADLLTTLSAENKRLEQARREAIEYGNDAQSSIAHLGQEVADMEERATAAEAEAQTLRAERDALWAALLWIDTYDPETTAAVETRFGIDLTGLPGAKLKGPAETPPTGEKG